MIVTRDNFSEVVAGLSLEHTLSVDTETTGLRPYHGHMLFSIVIASEKETHYFNFNEYEDLNPAFLLDQNHLVALQSLFSQSKTWIFHNAKFDLAMLKREGIDVAGTVYDTKVCARLVDNDEFEYSLAACAERIGLQKSDAVDQYITKHKLWDEEQTPGKKQRVKHLKFHHVPFDTITQYAEQDARVTLALYKHQQIELNVIAAQQGTGRPSILRLQANELELTKTVFNMEQLGVKVDLDFCRRAIVFENDRAQKTAAEFERLSGYPYKDSPLVFKEVFKDEDIKYGKTTPTGKNNPIFDADALAEFEHPAAKCILEYRDAKSKSDFYAGFLYHADSNSDIHCNFNQDGTATGRFSSSNPNLQNLTKDDGDTLEKSEFVIRRSIVPRSGYAFAMFDMDQAEYRLMLEYAGATELIRKVLEGLDVHQATADLAGIKRQQAKNCNFARLYGAGKAKMQKMLGCNKQELDIILHKIDSAAPEIGQFIQQVIAVAEKRGHIFNWAGRRLEFPDAKFAYKAPNYLIQGGVGDICKFAMNKVSHFLQGKKSRLVMQIHDELVFEIHESELYICPTIKEQLESVYKHRLLPLTWGCDHSYKSLADKVKGYPCSATVT